MSLNAFAAFTVDYALASSSDRDHSLDGVDTTYLDSGVLGWVQLGPAATTLFYLDKADSTTVPNGTTVVEPLTGPGRWKKLVGATDPAPAVLQTGSDAVLGNVALQQGAGEFFLLPRVQGQAANPVRVVFSTWTAGSFLRVWSRVNWRLIVGGAGESRMDIRCIVVVSLDDGVTWSYVNSSASRVDLTVPADQNMANGAKTQALMTVIGPLATRPQVAILCIIDNPVVSAATDSVQYATDSECGVDLLAEELRATAVVQNSPYALVAVVPAAPPFFP